MITSDVLILHVNNVIKEADNLGPRSLNKQGKGTSKMPIIEQQLSIKHHFFLEAKMLSLQYQ